MTIDHTRVGLKCDVSFNLNIYFERMASFAQASLLNYFLRLLKYFFKSLSAIARYTFFGLSDDN